MRKTWKHTLKDIKKVGLVFAIHLRLLKNLTFKA